ncbi:MAG: DUF962 domain-containing protein [Flavobacteriales bacterium]|nr:DUF962 domain-containing protein [Flavobacteriales bacterium]MCL4281792.1 DUF962 domain-containing protein [Flavobacteriales bacterium]
MPARPIQQWFDEYAESHRNPVNVAVHWIAVPVIFFTIVGLLYSIPPISLGERLGGISPANIAVAAVVVYYLMRSLSLAVGMALFCIACLFTARSLALHAAWPLWAICAGLFVLAWIAQFWGHGVEGKKPSFLKDIQFLLIGPAWLLSKIYRRLGIPY